MGQLRQHGHRQALHIEIIALLVLLITPAGCRIAHSEARLEALPSASPSAMQDPQKKKHRANAGIEEDGSIKRGQMPDGINNPDRWRYIPEGRLIEGTIAERLMNSTFVIPIFFYEKSLGSGFGGPSLNSSRLSTSG